MHRTSAETTSASRGKILRWLAAFLGPNLTLFLGPNPDPKSGPKQRPKRRNENVIQFWTPFWGPDLDPKMGSDLDPKVRSAIGQCGSCPPMFCKQMCDALACAWMLTYVFFLARPKLLLVQWRSRYGCHVFTTFLDPVLGAMMKQVCWHSRCSTVHRSWPKALSRTKNVLWQNSVKAQKQGTFFRPRSWHKFLSRYDLT